MDVLSLSRSDTTDWADDVGCPSEDYKAALKRWEIIDVVLGDTLSVRECREQILPKLPYEKKGYENRVKQIEFTPWFRRLVDGLVGVVLRKAPDLSAVDPMLVRHLADITLTGNDLNDFLRSLLLSYCYYGVVGVLVDSPSARAMLLSEEISYNIRPYWSLYHAKNIIGFRTARINNVLRLTQVRLSEMVDLDVGLYGVSKVQQIRTLNLDVVLDQNGEARNQVGWLVHRKIDNEWTVFSSGFLDLPEIPFYMSPGYEYGYPPFLQIAFMNISETRKKAELDHLLTLCATQKAVFSGFTFESDESDDIVTLGPEDGYVSEDPNASVTYVGANVSPAQEISKRIQGLQQEMMNLAIAAMYAQKNVSETVESKKMDRIQSDSMMALLADGMEKLINSVLGAHAFMAQVAEAGQIQVNKDFSNEILSIEAARFFADLVATGRMTVETFFDLLIRGELLPAEFSADAEIARLMSLASGNK